MTWRAIMAGSSAPADIMLNWLLQSTALLAIGLLIGRLSRRWGPAVQSAVYRTTLGAVLLCPIASIALTAMGLSGVVLRLPVLTASADQPAEAPDQSGLAITRSPEAELVSRLAMDGDPLASRTAPAPPLLEVLQQADRPDAAGLPPTAGGLADSPGRANESASSAGSTGVADLLAMAGTIAFAAWLLGTTALGVRLLVSHRRMARLRSAAIPAGADAASLCRILAEQMRLNPPEVLRSPFLSSPCLDGLRRPAILLPEDAEENLRETFIHELAHLSRRDGLWNFLRRIVSALLWVQPLVWFLSRRIEETAEEVCDEYVVEFGADRTRYAGHLLELAERTLPPLAASGVGMISLRSLLGRRIARILDPSRTLSTRAGRRAIAVSLLAGVVGTLLAGLVGVGNGHREARGDEPKTEKPGKAGDSGPNSSNSAASPGRKTVKGRVVDPDGHPIARAKVVDSEYHASTNNTDVDEYRVGSGYWRWIRKELDRALTDAEGGFTLTIVPGEPDPAVDRDTANRWNLPIVVARAPGFGPDWWDGSRDLPADHPLRLVRDDVPITGRIIDLEGRPVAGATIQVDRIVHPNDHPEFERWLDAISREPSAKKPEQWTWSFRELVTGMPKLIDPVQTDADGRFRLNGIGRDRLAILDIGGPSIAFERIQVITRKMRRVDGGTATRSPAIDRGYYGADCTIVAQPGQPIEGVIREAKTGVPIPGATITATNLATADENIEGLISTTSDAQGRYRLFGLPKAAGHRLSIYPSLDQPYFITDHLKTPSGSGLGPVRFDVDLKRGIWIIGRVTDAKTGRPTQAAIHYYPFLSNENARGMPNFHPGLSLFWTGHRYRTDRDGRYRVVGLPGRGIVAVKSFDGSYRMGVGVDRLSQPPGRQDGRAFGLPTYNQMNPWEFHAVSEVDPPAEAEDVHLDLTLQPGRSLTVQLVDPEGKPVTGASARGRSPFPNEGHDSGLDDQSRVEITGLHSKVARTVVFQHESRNLGVATIIKPGDAVDRIRTVTLRPCATLTGRVLDGDGKPVSGGVELRESYGDNNQSECTLDTTPLDAGGRFRIEGVVPGASYTLWVKDRVSYDPKLGPERFMAFAMLEDLTAEPSQVIDVGTFNAENQQRVKGPEHPPLTRDARAEAALREVPVNGRIVDLQGRPIAGVTVRVSSITRARGGDLTPWLEAVRRGEPPSVAVRQLDDWEEGSRRILGTIETDPQGRIPLGELDAESVVHLSIEGPTIAYNTFTVVTRRMEPIAARGFASTFGPGTQTIHGADFTFTATPSRVVEGVVRDEKTRKPMHDVGVWSYTFAGSNYIGITNLKARTDADGHFRLTGLPKGPGNKVLIVPNDDQPYFMQEFAVPDPPGIGPVAVEIGLHKGLWIEGKVTDKETGLPLAGGWLHYFPFLDNRFAQATPEFDRNGNTNGAGHQQRYLSRADGSYRLVGLPGRAIVGVVSHSEKSYRQGNGAEAIKGMNEHGHFGTWNNPIMPGRYFPTSMKEINPPEGAEVVHLDLELDVGARVRLRVVDPQGNPVTGVKTAGRTQRGRYDREAQTQAEIEVVTLGPGEDRMVLLRQEERKLGRMIHVKAGDDKKGPVLVTLEPAATIIGRVLDADGNPVAGATIRSNPRPSGDFPVSLPKVAAGKDGRFTVPDVPTGCEYSLIAEIGATVDRRRTAFSQQVAVRPGQTTDVGDIRFDKN